MQQDVTGIAEQRLRELEAAARVEQEVRLVGDADVGIERVGGEVLLHQVAEMVDVDDNVADAAVDDSLDDGFQQRLAVDFHQCLRPVLRQRVEARAEAGGEHHCADFVAVVLHFTLF